MTDYDVIEYTIKYLDLEDEIEEFGLPQDFKKNMCIERDVIRSQLIDILKKRDQSMVIQLTPRST
jgi:hypothetical protein